MAGFLRLSCDSIRFLARLLAHLVAHAPYRQEITGIVGFRLDLFSDLADKRHDVAGIEQVAVVPDRLVNLFFAKYRPAVCRKERKDVELLGVSWTGVPERATDLDAVLIASSSMTMRFSSSLCAAPSIASSTALSLPAAISENTGARSRASALPDEKSAWLSSAASDGVMSIRVLLVTMSPP